MAPQVAQQPTEAAQSGELREDQLDHVPDLLVRIELQAGVGADDVARRRLAHPLAAAGATEATGLHPLLNFVQFDPSREALHTQKDVVIEIPWIIQSVLIGQQRGEGGANRDQAIGGLVLAGEAIDLKAEDQADVAQGDLGEQPGEIVAAGRGGGGTALITVKDVNTFTWPTPGQGAVLEGRLNPSGFGMASHLLGMRLPDIDDGPAFEMVPLDLGGSVRPRGINGVHRPPPLGRERGDLGGGAESSGSAEPAAVAGVRGPIPASGGSPAGWARCESWTGGAESRDGRCRMVGEPP
jgi:hypothetical protein